MTLHGGTQGWKRNQSDFKSWRTGQDGCCILIRQKQAADIDLIALWSRVKRRGRGDVLLLQSTQELSCWLKSSQNAKWRTIVSLLRGLFFYCCAVSTNLLSMFNEFIVHTRVVCLDEKQWYRICACVIWDLSEIRHSAIIRGCEITVPCVCVWVCGHSLEFLETMGSLAVFWHLFTPSSILSASLQVVYF